MTSSIAPSALEAFALAVLMDTGMSEQSARIIGDHMVRADLRGVTTHGVSRLGYYLRRVEAGVMALDPAMTLRTDLPSAALLDAENGWGQVAIDRAMRLAIEKASSTGIGVVSVAHSNHFGVAGHYVERAAEAGLIGIVMTNASPAMAPFNGVEALLGTNPIAFGIPVADEAPIVLDMSSSVVARGKIRRASLEGASEIPAGWAVDRDGPPTSDPASALEGMLAPIGGAKGTGLALVIDLLTGVLSGTATTGTVANIMDTSRPSSTAHLALAIDPDAFIGRSLFAAEVRTVVDRIRAMPAADGTRVLVPGQLEHERTRSTSDGGVVIPDDVREDLDALAAEHGIEPLQYGVGVP